MRQKHTKTTRKYISRAKHADYRPDILDTIEYNIKIINMRQTLSTIANKYRGMSKIDIPKDEQEPLTDLLVVLLDIHGHKKALRAYETDNCVHM